VAKITPPIRPGASSSEYHHFWGSFVDAASLPNVAASPTQSPPVGGVNVLEAGDVAWAIAEACLYVCLDPTTTTAVWACMAPSGSAAPGHGSILFWGNDRLTGSATPQFLTPGYDDQVAATAAGQIRIPAPAAGVIRDMTVYFNDPYVPPPATLGDLDFILQVNGVDTALEVLGVPGDTAVVTSDNVNTVPVVAGDLLGVKVNKNLDPPPPPVGLDLPEGIVVTFRWT
jgi:hypothetical protein